MAQATLVGSGKQVRWASDIRRDALAGIDAFLAEMEAEPGLPADALTEDRETRIWLESVTAAEFWIKYGQRSATALLEQARTAHIRNLAKLMSDTASARR